MVTFNKEYILSSNFKMYSSQVLENIQYHIYSLSLSLSLSHNKNLFSFEVYYKILSKKSQIWLIWIFNNILMWENLFS